MRWDIVIVGAGTAGCVLASRLSRDPARSVLLVEAGPPDRHPFIHMPRGFAKVLADPTYTWPFAARARAGSNEPPAIWLRGRTLGGSSSVNGMMYVRGQPADFVEFAQLTSKDWDWSQIGRIYGEAEGDDGPDGGLLTSFPDPHPLMDRVAAAGAALGLKVQRDVNRPDDHAKIGPCPSTIFRGKRQSASTAFLKPAMARSNLSVVTGALVDRVAIEDGHAIAVDCLVNGERKRFEAGRIVLAGGTLASPALLQRSGVGDGETLALLGIEPMADRPEVGRNLSEHCALAMQWRLNRPLSLNPQFQGWRVPFNGLRYYLTRRGPMATAAYDVLGLFDSSGAGGRPDAQLIAAPFSIDKTNANLAMEAAPGMQIAVYPLRPRSRGMLAIKSTDPVELPEITLDMFADSADRAAMLGAVRFVRRLVAQRPLAETIAHEVRPGPQVASDDAVLGAYRAMGTTAYHAAGTCRMGDDPDAVVDPLTRVRGVERLHVADLSIAPFIPAGNTFAPTMAIAWRAAELIERLERTDAA